MNKTIKIAVASRSFSNHPILREELLQKYPNVKFNETGKTLSGSELIEFLKGHEKVIIALERLDEKVFSTLPELKVVSKYGVGLDTIDLDAMERHNILLGWQGGVNRRSVAELTLSFMISLIHRVTFATKEVGAGRWYQVRGQQLTGKTIGIIGCGNIGKDLVRLLKPFECKILVYDIQEYTEFYKEFCITPVNLETLLQESDIVTLHVPLNDSTKNLLNKKNLQFIKKGSFLINTARGGLVDEEALKVMLENRHLSGAALDVLSKEPPEDIELLNLPNVIVTPHIGGSTDEAILTMGRAAIEGLECAKMVSEIVPFYLR